MELDKGREWAKNMAKPVKPVRGKQDRQGQVDNRQDAECTVE